jgi:hypothetical protein
MVQFQNNCVYRLGDITISHFARLRADVAVCLIPTTECRNDGAGIRTRKIEWVVIWMQRQLNMPIKQLLCDQSFLTASPA